MTLTIKTILFPTDFSETSENALHYALALAKVSKAALHVIHVCQPPMLTIATTMDGAMVSRPAAEAELAKLTTRLSDVSVSTEVALGNPATTIVGAALARGADLIVMGTHGRGPIMHVLLGNVAELVVRTASCPVLTVRQQQQ